MYDLGTIVAMNAAYRKPAPVTHGYSAHCNCLACLAHWADGPKMSDNAMRMQMNPPSSEFRTVRGPVLR